MSESMQRCDNCLQYFPSQKVTSHFGYCRRNIKKCDICGEMYDKNYYDQHQEQFHKKDSCPHCKKQFAKTDIKKHIHQCPMKLKLCQYCQLNVSPKQFDTHFKACESRTKPCEKCRKLIMNKDYLVHIVSCQGIIQEPIKDKNSGYQNYIKQQRIKVNYNKPQSHIKSNQIKDMELPSRKVQVPPTEIYRNTNKNRNQPIPTTNIRQTINKPSSNNAKNPTNYANQIRHYPTSTYKQNQNPIIKYTEVQQIRHQGDRVIANRNTQKNRQITNNQNYHKITNNNKLPQQKHISSYHHSNNFKSVDNQHIPTKNYSYKPIDSHIRGSERIKCDEKKQIRQPIFEPATQFKQKQQSIRNNAPKQTKSKQEEYKHNQNTFGWSEEQKIMQRIMMENIQLNNKNHGKNKEMQAYNLDTSYETERRQQLAIEQNLAMNRRKK